MHAPSENTHTGSHAYKKQAPAYLSHRQEEENWSIIVHSSLHPERQLTAKGCHDGSLIKRQLLFPRVGGHLERVLCGRHETLQHKGSCFGTWYQDRGVAILDDVTEDVAVELLADAPGEGDRVGGDVHGAEERRVLIAAVKTCMCNIMGNYIIESCIE